MEGGASDPGGRRRTEKTSERVARQIVQTIARSGLRPGSTLPSETTLMERLQVGKSSLREALRFLEINGVLQVKAGPSGGPVVSAPGSHELGVMLSLHLGARRMTFRDLLHARIGLESLLAGVAARRPDGAAEVVEQARERGIAVRDADSATFEPVVGDYHGSIRAAAGNPALGTIAAAYQDIWLSRVGRTRFPRDDHDAILEEHDAITAAITARDEPLAARLMREHLQAYADHCERWYPAQLDDVVDWR